MTATRLNRRFALSVVLTPFLVPIASCGDDKIEPEDPKLTGEWTGQVTFPEPDPSAEVGLELTENEAGEVTGTITWTVADNSGSGPVTGTHNYPDVSLNLTITWFGEKLTGRYVAQTVSDDRMEGTFSSDDGSITEPLAMTRKSA